jgi:osmoprotectant transport system permease protein
MPPRGVDALHLWARNLLRLALAALTLWAGTTLSFAAAPPSSAATAGTAVVVGSKRFTESYVLGEVVRQHLQAAGVRASHARGLGNTGVLEQALATGAVDVYPEYTGTIARELLRRPETERLDLPALNRLLAEKGLRAAVPLGFNNTYALALREADAQRLGLVTLSDLRRAAEGPQGEAVRRLRLGLSHEFLVRADGWPGLQRAYALPQRPGRGLDHGLAYEAISRGQVDVIDVYSTDAQVNRRGLRVLKDDLGFFPRYDAVLLMRAGLDDTPLQALAGRIDEATMQALNAQVEVEGRSETDVAREWLAQVAGGRSASAVEPAASGPAATPPAAKTGFLDHLLAPDLPRLVAEHLALVLGSVGLAMLAGVPLGMLAAAQPRWGGLVVMAAGLLQTVPSLALLVFLIAALGTIGFLPALLALALYALLPIVRNTHAGLAGVPAGLRQAAQALGLRPAQVMRHVLLPLAWPVWLAGVRTAAVINVGTATIAAFIGAGGLGERIVAGLAVNDPARMLAGAVPAALLALALEGAFALLARRRRSPVD